MTYLGTYHSSFLSYSTENNILYNGCDKKDFIECIFNEQNCILKVNNQYISINKEDKFFLTEVAYNFRFILNANNTISILMNDKYLSAKPDSSISFTNKIMSWEQFTDDNNHKIKPIKMGYINYLFNRGNLPKMLACCCGNVNYGAPWFCTDLYQKLDKSIYSLDITRKFFFKSNIFDFVYIEHGLEHVEFNGVINFLTETYRILKPGGVLRVASPMLDNLIMYYLSKNDEDNNLATYIEKNWFPIAYDMSIISKAIVLNNAFYNFSHKCILDFYTYKQILSVIGYKSISKQDLCKSKFIELDNLESRVNYYAKSETGVFEAIK